MKKLTCTVVLALVFAFITGTQVNADRWNTIKEGFYVYGMGAFTKTNPSLLEFKESMNSSSGAPILGMGIQMFKFKRFLHFNLEIDALFASHKFDELAPVEKKRKTIAYTLSVNIEANLNQKGKRPIIIFGKVGFGFMNFDNEDIYKSYDWRDRPVLRATYKPTAWVFGGGIKIGIFRDFLFRAGYRLYHNNYEIYTREMVCPATGAIEIAESPEKKSHSIFQLFSFGVEYRF